MQIDIKPTKTGTAMPASSCPSRLRETLEVLLASVYPDQDTGALTRVVLNAFLGEDARLRRRGRTPTNTLWSERDAYLICYGNSLQDGQHKPLDLLHDFLQQRLRGTISGVHILPYFPYTSDDGFAVTDYLAV